MNTIFALVTGLANGSAESATEAGGLGVTKIFIYVAIGLVAYLIIMSIIGRLLKKNAEHYPPVEGHGHRAMSPQQMALLIALQDLAAEGSGMDVFLLDPSPFLSKPPQLLELEEEARLQLAQKVAANDHLPCGDDEPRVFEVILQKDVEVAGGIIHMKATQRRVLPPANQDPLENDELADELCREADDYGLLSDETQQFVEETAEAIHQFETGEEPVEIDEELQRALETAASVGVTTNTIHDPNPNPARPLGDLGRRISPHSVAIIEGGQRMLHRMDKRAAAEEERVDDTVDFLPVVKPADDCAPLKPGEPGFENYHEDHQLDPEHP